MFYVYILKAMLARFSSHHGAANSITLTETLSPACTLHSPHRKCQSKCILTGWQELGRLYLFRQPDQPCPIWTRGALSSLPAL